MLGDEGARQTAFPSTSSINFPAEITANSE